MTTEKLGPNGNQQAGPNVPGSQPDLTASLSGSTGADSAAAAPQAVLGEPNTADFHLGTALQRFLIDLGIRSRGGQLGDIERRKLEVGDSGPIFHTRLTSTTVPRRYSYAGNLVPGGHTLVVNITEGSKEPSVEVGEIKSFLEGAVALAGTDSDVTYGAIHLINPPAYAHTFLNDPESGWRRAYRHGRSGRLEYSAPDDYLGDAASNIHYVRFLNPALAQPHE